MNAAPIVEADVSADERDFSRGWDDLVVESPPTPEEREEVERRWAELKRELERQYPEFFHRGVLTVVEVMGLLAVVGFVIGLIVAWLL